jgi:uncharacterized protein YjdB
MLTAFSRRVALVLVFVALVGSCDSDPSAPPVDSADPIASLVVTPARVAFHALGRTQDLRADGRTVGGATVTDVPVSWESEDSGVASVSTAGRVTALRPGATRILAHHDTISAAMMVSVDQVAAELRLTPAGDTIKALGATVHLGATLLDSAAVAIPTQVLWDVSDSSVASLDSTGLLTARSPGSAVVTVAAGGMETQGEFVVRQVATEFSVRPASLALAVGGTAELQVEIRDSLGSQVRAAVVVWETRDSTVASVDGFGIVSATGPGDSWIITRSGEWTDSVAVTVVQEVASVVITPTARTLTAIGDSVLFSAKGFDGLGNVIDGLAVSWSAAPSGIITHMGSGLYEAVGEGVANVQAAVSGLTASATATVAQKLVMLALTEDSLLLVSIGEQRGVTEQLTDRNGHPILGRPVTWSSRDPSVATVTNGVVTSIGNGVAWVTAGRDGLQDSTLVRVAQQPVGVAITEGDQSLVEGASRTLHADVLDARGSPITSEIVAWTSSDEAIATVTTDGVVTAVSAGQTRIAAEGGGGRDSVLVTVLVPGADLPWEGDLVIRTQADIDSVVVGGFNRVTGSLTVEGSDLTALSALGIKTITGALRIQHNVSLVSIDLPVLEEVGGIVSVASNPALQSMALGRLGTAGGMSVFSSAGLSALSLPRLTTISGSFSLAGLSVADLSLPLLTSVGGETILSGRWIKTVDLPSLVFAAELHFIDVGLASLDLPSLNSVILLRIMESQSLETFSSGVASGTLIFLNNTSLQSIGLDGFTDGWLDILANPELRTVSAVNARSVSFRLHDSPLVTEVRLDALTDAQNLELVRDSELASLSLPSLARVPGRLLIDQSRLADLGAFSALQSGVEQISITANAELTDVSGLSGLGNTSGGDPIVSGSLTITGNTVLPDAAVSALLAALEAKYEGAAVGGTVTVSGNGG